MNVLVFVVFGKVFKNKKTLTIVTITINGEEEDVNHIEKQDVSVTNITYI